MPTVWPRGSPALLRDVPDFPQPGILFKDIAPLLADGRRVRRGDRRRSPARRRRASTSSPASRRAGSCSPARWPASSAAASSRCARPASCRRPRCAARYDLEYGSAEIEVPVGVLDGQRVLLVDDVLATGGTLRAAAELLAEAGATVVGLAVIVELTASSAAAPRCAGLPPLHALCSSV